MLHQKRWNSSARCIQYAATVIQLTLEVMQDHLLKAETNKYIGALLFLMESSDVHTKVRSISCVSVLNHPPNIFLSLALSLSGSPSRPPALPPSLPPSLSLINFCLSVCVSVLCQEWGANSITTIVSKAQGEVVNDVLLHASALKSVIAAISPAQNKYVRPLESFCMSFVDFCGVLQKRL